MQHGDGRIDSMYTNGRNKCMWIGNTFLYMPLFDAGQLCNERDYPGCLSRRLLLTLLP